MEKSGHIITNNHVVQNSEEIMVRLSDKRQFKGKVIGLDPKTDLAVIKINADNLPVLNLGDSDKLKVGERVLAIAMKEERKNIIWLLVRDELMKRKNI